MHLSITKKELLVIVTFTVFALVWTAFVITYMSSWIWFQAQIPPVQFFIFELGYMAVFVALVGVPVSYLMSGKKHMVQLWIAFKLGLSSWIGIGLLYDLFQPPYFLNASGQTLLNNPSALTGTAVDAALAWGWSQIGVHGALLYYFVYALSPILMLVFVALLFIWKKFVKLLSGFA